MVKFSEEQFVYLGLRIANKQDKGLRLSVAELKELVEGEKLIPWIELNICSLDFWDNDARRVMEVEFWSIYNCYDFGETDCILFRIHREPSNKNSGRFIKEGV